MLPATPPPIGAISDVAENLLHTLTGRVSPWGWLPVSKVALIVIDGLGSHNLAAHSGHARFLNGISRERGHTLHSGLPSTTASALASLTTGALAGAHGMLGYSVRDPATGALVNHLKPFPAGVETQWWQPLPTIFDRLRGLSIASQALGEARFAGTDFSEAVLRGSEFVASNTLDTHLQKMREFFDGNDQGLSYVYWPGIDRLGHSDGVGSEAWVDELEKVDNWVQVLVSTLGPGEACVVTADHGMVTVRDRDRVVMPSDHPLRSAIDIFGGEPRMLHLYTHDGVLLSEFAEAMRGFVGLRGRVLTRDEACSQGIFGAVTPEHVGRIGDVVVLAADSWAFYDEASASVGSYRMIGQHGSDSAIETIVPFITAGHWSA